MLKRCFQLRETAESDDNSLWVCHYKYPFHITHNIFVLFIYSILICAALRAKALLETQHFLLTFNTSIRILNFPTKTCLVAQQPQNSTLLQLRCSLSVLHSPPTNIECNKFTHVLCGVVQMHQW